MKRLLLPLLAALALPASVNTGDLGSADLVNSVFRGKHYDEYPEQTDFDYRCGGTIAVVKKCVVRFTQGRLIVDDSVGMTDRGDRIRTCDLVLPKHLYVKMRKS